MFRILKSRDDGFRQIPGTALRHEQTGEIIYVPPQGAHEVVEYMSQFEKFLNNGDVTTYDPLINMALLHHQFESIHPFPDGNGRIGRIINVLYLVKTGLLEIPVLYLSRYITSNKTTYYKLLQDVRDTNGSQAAWEAWVLFILTAVNDTSKTTLRIVEGIRSQMAKKKKEMREKAPNLYSQDLLNNLFRHPYTRIEFVVKDLGVTRQTAAKYLDNLDRLGFVKKQQAGRNNYYINTDLVRLFLSVSGGT